MKFWRHTILKIRGWLLIEAVRNDALIAIVGPENIPHLSHEAVDRYHAVTLHRGRFFLNIDFTTPRLRGED
jgi:hypothetical protein